MKSDQWYAVKHKKDSKEVYLMNGGDRRMVEATASSMFRSPVIVKLTWMMMKVLTGCTIPRDKLMTDYCHGAITLPYRNKVTIIIKVL